MKKLISLISAAAIMLSLTACGNADTVSDLDTDDAAETVEEAAYSRPLGEMRDISTSELISEMVTGWNLGNTMDADSTETAWGNPVTTKAMIDEIYKAGFNTIRIPTTWAKHMGDAPDYTIDSEWISRVEEIADYALENDMYVIINTHHETDWITPQYDGLDDVKTQFAALWKQIAEYFADYGDHLIFEGLNEPRIVGGTNEWNGGTEENRDAVNQLNELFVETVRATGGNNSTRTLLITTVAATSTNVAISALEIPDDEHVAVSIHAYTPYRFTYESTSDTSVYDTSCASEIDTLFASLNDTFISKGVPVIITEYGAVNKISDGKSNSEDVRAWASHYVETAKSYGIPCIWWDNGVRYGSGELFGIFNRKDLVWYDTDLVDAIVNAAKQ